MDEAPVAPTETAPVEAAAPVETSAPAEVTTAPEPTANLLGSTDNSVGIQPDTSNEPWFNQLDEEYRTNPNVQKYGSMNELAKGLINAQAVIGKKGIIRPGEDATPEEMGSYFDSLGRPTEASAYEYTPIEGAPDVDPEAMSNFQNWAHGKGISQDHYQDLIEYQLQDQQNSIAQLEQERTDEVGQTRMSIYDEMGEIEGNAMIRDADAAGKALGLNDVFVEAGIANNENVIRALAKAAKSLGSSSMVGEHGVGSLDFEGQVKELQSNPAYKDKMHPEYRATQDKVNALYKARFPG